MRLEFHVWQSDCGIWPSAVDSRIPRWEILLFLHYDVPEHGFWTREGKDQIPDQTPTKEQAPMCEY